MPDPMTPSEHPARLLDAEERALGMGAGVTRRDFLGGTALGAGAALLTASAPSRCASAGVPGGSPDVDPWTGYAGVGDYARSNGNTREVMGAAHAIRDDSWGSKIDLAAPTGEVFDLVVVGGGFAGIGSAYFFAQSAGAGRSCLVLENHAMAGGEAKRNEFMVRGQRLIGPQGSNDTDFHTKTEGWLGKLWRDLGLPADAEYGRLADGRRKMILPRDNYMYQLWSDDFDNHGFFFDSPSPRWVRNPWGNNLAGMPWPDELKHQFLRWRNEPSKPFAGTPDQMKRWLDTMTYEQYLTRERGLPIDVARYADPLLASAAGLGCDAMSAYAAFYDDLPGFRGLGPNDRDFGDSEKLTEPQDVQCFPGGNDAILRAVLKSVIPGSIDGDRNFTDIHNGTIRFEALDRPGQATRIRVGATVVSVADAAEPKPGKPATIVYAKDGVLHSVQARAVIIASGSWNAKHIVAGLPHEYLDAMQRFPRSPVLVVNVALDNWRFLYSLGYSACSWRGGFGFTANIRPNMYVGDYRPVLDPDHPNLLTFYVPLTTPGAPIAQQGAIARAKLLATSYRDYERAIRTQMTSMFSMAGFDPGRDIAGIVLNRWGHAYVNAGPGFYFGTPGRPAPPDVLRRKIGCLAFAHSELNGNQNWTSAVGEARRAVQQVTATL